MSFKIMQDEGGRPDGTDVFGIVVCGIVFALGVGIHVLLTSMSMVFFANWLFRIFSGAGLLLAFFWWSTDLEVWLKKSRNAFESEHSKGYLFFAWTIAIAGLLFLTAVAYSAFVKGLPIPGVWAGRMFD